MFCELLKLCKQFELSATMRQQQRQQRQQQQLLQRRQQKVAQSFLMLFGGTGYVSVFFCFPPSLPWTHARRGTGSATLMKRLSGSCCTCHSPLNPLPPHCSRWCQRFGHTHTDTHIHGKKGVAAAAQWECKACPGNGYWPNELLENVINQSDCSNNIKNIIIRNFKQFYRYFTIIIL